VTNHYGLQTYRHTLARTADRRATITYLFDVAIMGCRKAVEAIEANEMSKKGKSLDQAMAAVMELSGALDFERGGALAARLHALYAYLVRSIIVINAQNDSALARGCAAVLRTLREGWDQIVRGRIPQAAPSSPRVAVHA
jgi:flagellar secretion chaperone FliS